MTVCVAAVCDNGCSVAIASDRQLLNSPEYVVSGTEECKVKPLAPHAALIFTGLGTFADRLVEVVGIRQWNEPILSISKAVQRAFLELSQEYIEERFLIPKLNMTTKEFMEQVFLNPLGNVAQEAWKEFCTTKNSIEFGCAVVGADAKGAHVFQAAPVLIETSSKYVTIGIGREPATWVLSLVKHNAQCTLVEGLFNVLLAKTVAFERSIAVGEKTDIFVQSTDGLTAVSESLRATLVQMCSGRLERLVPSDDEKKCLESRL